MGATTRAGGQLRINGALRRLWRDATTMQVGLDPGRTVIITGVDTPTARLMRALDGTLDRGFFGRRAAELGVSAERTELLLRLLAEGGVLDTDASPRLASQVPPGTEWARLAPDISALSVTTGSTAAAHATVRRRREARVRVVGASRVGTLVAALLAAAGVGRLDIADDTVTTASDAVPGGARVTDAGLTRAQAARAAVLRAAPSACTDAAVTDAAGARRPDLTVLCPDAECDPAEVADLMRAGTPHLWAGVREITGVVGPLVVPGRTACLHCLDLHRTDRDPAWPMLAAQLATPAAGHTPGCDVVLATLVAAHAAHETLRLLDTDVSPTRDADGTAPATFDATLEIRLPDVRVRRRSWRPHPACGCRWGQAESAGTQPRPESGTMHPRPESGTMQPRPEYGTMQR